jgi:hypothetical protein
MSPQSIKAIGRLDSDIRKSGSDRGIRKVARFCPTDKGKARGISGLRRLFVCGN